MKKLVTVASLAFLLAGCGDTSNQSISTNQGGASAVTPPASQPKTGTIIELPMTVAPDCQFTVLNSTGLDKFGPYLSLSSNQCGTPATEPRKVKTVPLEVEGDFAGLEVKRSYIAQAGEYSTYIFVEAVNTSSDVNCNYFNYQLGSDDEDYYYNLNMLSNSFEFVSEYDQCISANEAVLFYSEIWRSDIERINNIKLMAFSSWDNYVYTPSPRSLQSIEKSSDNRAIIRYLVNPANVVQGWSPEVVIQDASGYFVDVADITTDRVIVYSNANAAYEADATELFKTLQPNDKVYFNPDFIPVDYDPIN